MLDLTVHGVQIQIWNRSTTTDGLGNTKHIWTTDGGTEYGILSPVKASEIQLNVGETIDSRKDLIVSKDSAIVKTDRIEYNSITYEPIGSENEWVRKYRGADTLKIIPVRRVDV